MIVNNHRHVLAISTILFFLLTAIGCDIGPSTPYYTLKRAENGKTVVVHLASGATASATIDTAGITSANASQTTYGGGKSIDVKYTISYGNLSIQKVTCDGNEIKRR